MIRQYELVERVRSYDADADEQLLNRAYVFSMKAHGAQTRASGDPYFSHPLEVAGILTELKLDCATIVTALLHDTVEDTVATPDQIRSLFGDEIARLVDGVTKLSQIEFASDDTKQAENFRKLLIAMSNDIRVLLVKLVDRLHNMRTLHFIKDQERRRRIALETMEIYAPLAERIGMRDLKDELEDLAFEQLNSEARASILARLEFLRRDGGKIVEKIEKSISSTLKKGGVDADVIGREKHPFSIWRKMDQKKLTFDQLSDIIAFRIVIKDDADCYQVMGVLHAAWPNVPGTFKDYVSLPKPNGYQSLHTAVMGPEQRRIELQIRTEAMHQIAERGVAAHWRYKQGQPKVGAKSDPKSATGPQATPYRWLRELLEILENAETMEEFLEHTKLEMFQDQVFCFSPKGDLIALPQGATPVDFAYAVHTEIGNACVGAKVNGRLTALRSILENGDQVEIICSETQEPMPQWEDFVVSGKAQSAIRQHIRKLKKAEYLTLGAAIIKGTFRQQGKRVPRRQIARVAQEFHLESSDELYGEVGRGNLTGQQVFKAVYPDETFMHEPNLHPGGEAGFSGPVVPVHGLKKGHALHYGACCHPLPGDRIVGIMSQGHGINVHTIDCSQLEPFHDQPDLWCDVNWDPKAGEEEYYLGQISLVVQNTPGALGKLSEMIADGGGNISNLDILDRSPEFYEMTVDIEVHDVKQLAEIIMTAHELDVIEKVERIHG